jgi:molybdenum cofactor cytidylyltransferase
VLGHLIEQWQSLQAGQIAVVCAETHETIQRELDRLGFPTGQRIFNPAPERGMFSSIQCAAAWNGWERSVSHFVIVLGDQPHLRPATLQALLDFAAANSEKICQPSRQGRGRHPVILPRFILEQLQNSPQENLKGFLQSRAHLVALCEIDDPALDVDLDTPADYEQVSRRFAGNDG